MVTFVFRPLGPFVPAPPEIAMHMMREQAPPQPFEPNGAPHGNTGVLAPMLGGPAPIITMPPNFRHDPRRLRRLELLLYYHDRIFSHLLAPTLFNSFSPILISRSYNDLDAPDEEVTVLDYRSL